VSKRLSAEIGQLREEWFAAAGQPRRGSVGRRLIGLLPRQPVVDAGTVSAALEVSERTALRGLTALAEAGIVSEVTKQKRNRVWVAVDVFDVLDEVQSWVTRPPAPRDR
jgi:Fic family protein